MPAGSTVHARRRWDGNPLHAPSLRPPEEILHRPFFLRLVARCWSCFAAVLRNRMARRLSASALRGSSLPLPVLCTRLLRPTTPAVPPRPPLVLWIMVSPRLGPESLSPACVRDVIRRFPCVPQQPQPCSWTSLLREPPGLRRPGRMAPPDTPALARARLGPRAVPPSACLSERRLLDPLLRCVYPPLVVLRFPLGPPACLPPLPLRLLACARLA